MSFKRVICIRKKRPSSEGVGATNMNAEAKGDTRVERVRYEVKKVFFYKLTLVSLFNVIKTV